MILFAKFSLVICGLLLLAAFPAFGQNDEPIRETQINEQPLIELADYVVERLEKDGVDLAKPFKVIVEGKLIKKIENGRGIVVLDQQNLNWIRLSNEEAGDPQVGEIAKKAILAVTETGVFQYFYNLGIKDLKISFYQTDFQAALSIESDLSTPERAKTIVSGLKMMFTFAKSVVKGKDEKIILDSFKTAEASGNSLYLNFEMPKNTFQLMINQNLTICRNRTQSEQK